MAKKQGDIRYLQGIFDSTTRQFLGISDPSSPGDGVDFDVPVYSDAQVEAGATGAVASTASGDLVLPDGSRHFETNITRKNLGLRMLTCRSGAFDNTTQQTFRNIIEVAVEGFDAIRPIFANAGTSTFTISGCNARVIGSPSDAMPSPTAVTLPGSGVVPARKAADRKSYLVGDWVFLPSIPRTDGGKGALVVFDCYVSTSASITIMGNGTSDVLTGWATRANRKWIIRRNAGDCVTTPANFVSTTNISQSPLVGVQYLSRGKVISVMGIGDSITDGRGTIIGEGFGVPATEAASSDAVTFEWANLGWAGAQPLTYSYYLDDFISDTGIIPNIVVHPNASPNGFSTPILDSEISVARGCSARLSTACSRYGIYEVNWTVLPTNPSVKDYNSSDSKRVELNTDWLTKYYSAVVLDFSKSLSGVTDVDGQVNMLAGSTTDSIHPNDAGNAILSPILATELSRVAYW